MNAPETVLPKVKKSRLHNRVNREVLLEQMRATPDKRVTLSFYAYARITDPASFRDAFYLKLDQIGVKGRIYVAEEGINAQISVPKDAQEAFKALLSNIDFLRDVRLNYAVADNGKSFFKLKIQVRPKIVADGLDDATFDPSDHAPHLDAQAFNALTDDPDTIVVDMRNHYESEVGYFENALRPDVETFREALPVVEKLLENDRDKNIVMYCTGGIRCEKAGAYYKHKGFKNVFQLEGGIIEYARQVNNLGLTNKFKGVNFVFDERLGERISEDVVSRCHQCGAPCDAHTNCANEACHLLFIQCPECAAARNGCCSTQCADFIQLPQSEQVARRKTGIFNGSRFGKGRFDPNRISGE